MINVSNKFRQLLSDDDRSYLAYVDITLADGTVFNLTNSEIWVGGLAKEDAVSDDNTFNAVGSAVVNSATFIINNVDDEYSIYDFDNAKVVTYVGKEIDGVVEKIRLGTYKVDEPKYNGATISLYALDNMAQFDRPYSVSALQYPATLSQIVLDACTVCGVELGSVNFPYSNYTVQERPSEDTITFRTVISWVAGVIGCFAKCNPAGQLIFKWFNRTLLESVSANLDGGVFDESSPTYTSGDSADGGSFNPWDTGYEFDAGEFNRLDEIHYISSLYSQNIGVDDIIITGVKIDVETQDEDGNNVTKTYSSGGSGYTIELSGNKFITTDTAQDITDRLGEQLIGLKFRQANISHINDPTIEAGDIAIIIDHKNNTYPILVTRTNFAVGRSQTTVCGAETPARNSASVYNEQVKNYVALKSLLNSEKTVRELALQELKRSLTDQINSSAGLYTTIETTQSGNIYYMHNKQNLSESDIVWKMTAEALAVSTDGGQTYNFGVTVNGTVISNILSTIGISFDWARGGTLTLGGQDNTNGEMRILDASGNETGRFNNNGINMNNGKFSVDSNGNVQAMSFTAYGSLLCYEHYVIT